jgi:apolipoprotein N-acyltransferase
MRREPSDRSLAVALTLTLASAGLYALAFPPVRARPLAWVALVPLLAALRDASLRRRLGLGLLWTLAVGWGVGTWMPGAVAGYFQQPLAVGVGLFLLVTGAMAAPYYMAFSAAYAPLVVRFGVTGPLLAGAAWAGAELLRGRLLNGTSFYVGNSPWATFGYSQAEMTSVIQIASVTGVYGISFVLVAVNAAVAEVVHAIVRERRVERQAWMGLALAMGTLGLALAFGRLVLRSADTVARGAAPVPIALAQANLGPAARWGSEGPARTFAAYVRLTAETFDRGRPRIVFWPEMALTVFLEQDEIYRHALADALGRYDAELVIGAPRAGGPEGAAPYANSVYLVAADGTLVTRYDKQYLLPFMEYFPLRVDMVRRRFGRIDELTPGEPTPPLPTRAGKAGILVCNEALLPHVAGQRIAEGADYLVNPANDSWVPNAGFAWQQFDIVSLRAVEQRRYLVRISDSGPSGVVDPFGRIVAHTAALARGVLLASIVPIGGRSPYARWGDLFGGGCLLATALALIRRRRRGP